MGKMLGTIPYKSQYDSDASEFRNDCGPACVAMILNGLGVKVTTNAVFRKSGANRNAYVSVTQMIKAAASLDVDFDYFYPWSMSQLKSAVASGMAPICLVHYGAWRSRGLTQSSFTGPHFVVVVGFDEEHIIVNDPLWWGSRREEGMHRHLTYAEFEAAWSTASKDGNRNYSGIFCKHRLEVTISGSATGIEEPIEEIPELPPFTVDPLVEWQIHTWATYFDVPLGAIDSEEILAAYVNAMGDWGLRIEVHQVVDGDTLPLIALRYYDDPLKWEVITLFNGLEVGDPISAGDVLLIPEPVQIPVDEPEEEEPTDDIPHDEIAAQWEKKLHEISDDPKPKSVQY